LQLLFGRSHCGLSLLIAFDETDNAIDPLDLAHLSLVFEMVQVGDRLSHGEHDLVRIQLAREERAEKLPGAAWLGTGRKQFRAAAS
jgi:hypothetical protein